ncbi:MAG: class II aldolase/adducin family protein [Terracidiphilus sp.]
MPATGQGEEAVHAAENPQQTAHPGFDSPLAAANSHEAQALRAEIVEVGRKLWEREYVDGNAGNLSARLGSHYVLCTPTRVSKGEMRPEDLCLCDLDGAILAGNQARTTEILLHLEIYKANPQARGIVHCHPPYATAFAMTGSAPPAGLHSEFDTMIGPAAVAPYETPGTEAFARTVVPFVHESNTILLANHGIVCWADTLTHAEWLVETFEAYCRSYLIALEIGRPLKPIPDEKIADLLAMKRKMGLPDARLGRVRGRE